MATAGRHHRVCVATHAALIPLYWNRAWPVRLSLPIIPGVNASARRFGGFEVRQLVPDDSVTYRSPTTGNYTTGFTLTAPPKPTSKALISPLSGGDIAVQRGIIQPAPAGESQWDQGIIDPDTAETIRCASRKVDIFLPPPPQYQNKPLAFIAVRKDDKWYLSRCWQLGSSESGDTVWHASPAMFYLDALHQPHNLLLHGWPMLSVQ